MTTTRDSDRGDEAPGPDRLRLDHLRVGLGRPSSDGGVARETPSADLVEILAPFVAWLATQDLDEAARRRHREATERFLLWSRTDDGSVRGRRRRYEQHVAQYDTRHLEDARAGLDRWLEHRRLIAQTLPVDG